MRKLAEELEKLALAAGENDPERPELEKIAELLEDAGEALAGGVQARALNSSHYQRIAKAFNGVGEALGGGGEG